MLAEGNLGSFTLSSLLGTSRLQTQSLFFRLYLLSLHSILKFNGALSLWSPVVHIVDLYVRCVGGTSLKIKI